LAVAQIVAGAALLSGLYFTWRTLQVNREGQITERFTRAIDQLGSKELEIRLGGIYALERIARDSERDHWSIMEVLTAYVRQHAPWSSAEGKEGTEDADVVKKVPSPDADIQAIMTVIQRRLRSYGHGEPDSLDLHNTNLKGVNLSGANLERVNLWEANLENTTLTDAILRFAALARANLSGALLGFLRPLEEHLPPPRRYTGADLTGAFLSFANLREAILIGANLWLATLTSANGSRAVLVDASLIDARLQKANLTEADLSGADLSGADLSEAKRLTQEQLDSTSTGDKNTRLPPDLKPPAHWGGKTDEQIEGD
jgi:hypothetical protein